MEPTKAMSTTLDRIALEMTSVLDLGELLGTITDGLVADFDAALARIWLLEAPPCPRCGSTSGCQHQAARLRLRASSGLSRRLDGSHASVPLGNLKTGVIAATREPVCIDDPEHDTRIADPAWVRQHQLRSFAGYPLVFRSELLGVLALFSRQKLDQAAFERLGTFASQAAVAIKNARLFAALDAMTGRLRDENAYLREEVRGEHAVGEHAVGQSVRWFAAMDAARQVASTDATVLITGETGTGKELLARAIHELSPRRGHALVRMNCAAIAPSLVESELFGHEKGAFTGATARRIGRFEMASGGTLFLDEIGELPLEAQAVLLRVLQEREFERVGGRETVRVDVRVVAATNRDLPARIAAGAFRADLYYRLSVFPIEAPALRERLDDVPLLVDAFVTRASHRLRKPLQGVTPGALAALTAYDWPGNVRELENVIERAAILARSDRIEPTDLPPLRPRAAQDVPGPPPEAIPPSSPAPASVPDSHSLVDVERAHIERVLRETRGVIEGTTGAAARLGLHPSTLRSRMAKLGVTRPRRA